MFSIIIPVFNKENYIKKAIHSVLAQTFKKIELVIINDGSTDHSLEIVQSIPDERIKVVSQQNQGVSTARNNAVKLAKYDYIAFLDADDWWDSGYLEKISELIFEYKEASVFASKYYWVKGGNFNISINHENDEFKGYFDYIKAYCHSWWMPLSSSSTVIRKDVFWEIGGFKKDLKFGEDFDLWIRLALNYKLAYLNKPLVYLNQDVDLKSRAIGIEKIYHPAHHYIFNLNYLSEIENRNSQIKLLLDGLRVRALFKYYLSGKYMLETINELKKVNFRLQPAYFRVIYQWPHFLIRFYFKAKFFAYKVVQSIRKTIQNLIN